MIALGRRRMEHELEFGNRNWIGRAACSASFSIFFLSIAKHLSYLPLFLINSVPSLPYDVLSSSCLATIRQLLFRARDLKRGCQELTMDISSEAEAGCTSDMHTTLYKATRRCGSHCLPLRRQLDPNHFTSLICSLLSAVPCQFLVTIQPAPLTSLG